MTKIKHAAKVEFKGLEAPIRQAEISSKRGKHQLNSSGKWLKPIPAPSEKLKKLLSPCSGSSEKSSGTAYKAADTILDVYRKISKIKVVGIKEEQTLTGHSDMVAAIAYSPDGKRMVSGSYDGTLIVWDANTGKKLIGPLKGHFNFVRNVAFSPDGEHIVSGSSDHSLIVWDAYTGEKVLGPLEGHSNEVYSVAYSPDGKYIVSGSYDKTLILWDANSGKKVLGPLPGSDSIWRIDCSPDGEKIVSASDDGAVTVWDANSGDRVLGPLKGHSDPIFSVAFSPDGKCIASGSYAESSEEGTLIVWNTKTGDNKVGSLSDYRLSCLAYGPDNLIVTGSFDGALCVWDDNNVKIVFGPKKNFSDGIMSISFSPDGNYIACGCCDHKIRILKLDVA